MYFLLYQGVAFTPESLHQELKLYTIVMSAEGLSPAQFI